MGITGLLPALKDVTDRVHLSKYKGKTLGIDAYVWLHRGAYGCAEALALGRPTDAYVKYAMGKIHMLRHFGITPYVVFDGDRLPAKAKTEDDRRRKREESRAKARQLTDMGKRSAAREHYVRCVDVTPAMAFQLIKALRAADVQYIVAPYEADAQLAYLERRGAIDAVVSEDSDLLVFGCKAVLYKLRDDGYCDEILHSRRHRCASLALHAFSDDMFRQMAILSGCDYLPSLPKMGLKTANEMLRKYTTVAQILAVVASKGTLIPSDYRSSFEKAEKTFVYQRVFDRSEDGSIRLTTLTSISGEEELDDCIGPKMSADVARGIAYGDLDPITRLPIEDLTKAGTSAAAPKASFYAQTRPSWMRERTKKRSSSSNTLPGQSKLAGFFAKSVSGGNASQRTPLSSKDVNRINNETDRDLKRARQKIDDTLDLPPKGKSKFFAAAVNSPTQPLPLSPVKVYEGSAHLASFSTPTQQRRTRKRTHSAHSSDGGLISSPPSSSVVMETGRADSPPLLDDHQPRSSPSTSPSLAVHEQKTKCEKVVARGTMGADSIDEENVSANLFDRFRFTDSKSLSTPAPVQTSSAAWSFSGARSAQRSLFSSSRKEGSAAKRALAVNMENDPFDDDVDEPNTSICTTPTNNNNVERTSTRFTLTTTKAIPVVDTPKEALSKRSNSYRRLKLGQ